MSRDYFASRNTAAQSVGVAVSLAGAWGAMLQRAVHFRRRRYIQRARQMPSSSAELVRDLDIVLMEARLAHAQQKTRKAERRAAELEADLIAERLARGG